MQGVEIGVAVNAQDHGLAVQDKPLLPDLACRLDDPWVPASPIEAVAGEQAYAITVTLYAKAITVVFYFVKPFGAGRHGLAGRGEAELKTGHGPKIGRVSRICESELQ